MVIGKLRKAGVFTPTVELACKGKQAWLLSSEVLPRADAVIVVAVAVFAEHARVDQREQLVTRRVDIAVIERVMMQKDPVGGSWI